jgi:hypothetical protein
VKHRPASPICCRSSRPKQTTGYRPEQRRFRSWREDRLVLQQAFIRNVVVSRCSVYQTLTVGCGGAGSCIIYTLFSNAMICTLVRIREKKTITVFNKCGEQNRRHNTCTGKGKGVLILIVLNHEQLQR